MSLHDTLTINPVSSGVPAHISGRSSQDSSPRTPTSPFLQNLSNRFRKGSNASTFSHMSEPPSLPIDAADKADSVQSAKRFVLNVIRNDWEWPPSDPTTVSGGENVTEDEKKQDSLLAQRDPIGWRTRFEGASDFDLDLSPVSPSGKKKTKRSSDPYRFESPDAIANVIQEQRLRARRANAEETTWNEGLRFWTEQRDAWTSARPHKQQKRAATRANGDVHTLPEHTRHKDSRSSGESKNSQSTQSSGIPMPNGTHKRRVTLAGDDASVAEESEDSILNGPYLPIYPPLFPTSHTLRARIKPASYPTIYSKVVLQSLSPNVPIPLTHMIGALVDGWKAEGNWPPQTIMEQRTHALLKRAKGGTKGESAFQKWRKERDVERTLQQDLFEGEFGGLVDEDEGKKGFRKSISGAVKKVLGIHVEEDEDGGLSRLGLKFGNEDDEAGLMKESRQVTEDNVTLNKTLLEGEKKN